jgi:hypothetical protein
MDGTEARSLLRGKMTELLRLPYAQLTEMVEKAERYRSEVTGPSGTAYQIVIDIYWDSGSSGDIRVVGCVDDRGWRAFMPLTEDFIKGADESALGWWNNGLT